MGQQREGGELGWCVWYGTRGESTRHECRTKRVLQTHPPRVIALQTQSRQVIAAQQRANGKLGFSCCYGTRGESTCNWCATPYWRGGLAQVDDVQDVVVHVAVAVEVADGVAG